MTTLGLIGASVCVVGLLIWLLMRQAGDAAREKWRRGEAEYKIRKARGAIRRMARRLPSDRDMDAWVRSSRSSVSSDPRAGERDGD